MGDPPETIDPAAQLRWLADQGARFTLPRGRTKGRDEHGNPTLQSGWQQTPHAVDEALAHAARGGNVGLLTGKQSAGIVALDLDREYENMLAAIGPYANTVKVFRENEPTHGKLLYRVRFEVASRAWQPAWEEVKKPWAELLSEGKHAVIPPSLFEGGRYVLRDKELGIAELSEDDLALVWWKVTEGRPGLATPEGWQEPEAKPAPAPSSAPDQDQAKAIVLEAWAVLDVFKHHGLAREIAEERGGELRLLGNGGLLVKGEQWFCFSADQGGADAISAWAYCTRQRATVSGREFWDVLREMATARGVELPRTHVNGDGAAARVAAAYAAGEVDDGEEEQGENAGRHPLDVAGGGELQLGEWLDRYTEVATHLTGSPPDFNRLGGLVAAATALQRKARLRMSFADIYPNIYAAFVGASSVWHKSSALAFERNMIRRALLENLLLSELQTSEGLLAELQAKGGGVILRDEIGTLFDSGRVKYLRNLKPDLTALFDCYPYSRRLSQLEVKVEKPYLNILGATTPARFYEGVSLTDWRDGFLPRWLFVLPEGEPNFDAMTGLLDAQYDAAIGELASQLHRLSRQEETDFTFAGDAHALWDGRQRQAAKEAYYYGDDIAAAIVTRYSAYALKFALILAALNGPWGVITPETMRSAIDLADYFKRHIYRLLSERDQHEVSGGQLQKVFAVIKGEGAKVDGWVPARTVLRKTHLRKAQLDPCLDKLVEVGAVVREEAGRSFKYMAATETLPIKSWR